MSSKKYLVKIKKYIEKVLTFVKSCGIIYIVEGADVAQSVAQRLGKA